ncbi:MAG: hypothetical protein V4548_08805 [Bacteroidota bacterium]
MKIKILFCLLFITQLFFGQNANEKLIHGKIVADSIALEGIEVVNLVNEKATVTNTNGEFFILAKADDLLFISGKNVEIKRKTIEEEDLKLPIIVIQMVSKAIEIEEVTVEKKSDGISIIPGVKKLTPAQRKLYTAQSGILDMPLNWMSGWTAMLKKELVVEGKERLLAKIAVLYEEQFYVEKLKIPADYIKDFQYYVIDDKPFVAAMKAKNKDMMKFLIGKLAASYNQLMTDEK